MSHPIDYKSLKKWFLYPSDSYHLSFRGGTSIFLDTPFYPFVRSDGIAEVLDCPTCEEPCLVDDEGEGRYVMYCEACDEFHTLTTADVECCRLDLDELIRGIATANGYETERSDDYWYFGRPLIAHKYRNLYFTPYPTEELLHRLLKKNGSILFTMNTSMYYRELYPDQLYTLADLQISPFSLKLNMDKVEAILSDKPKEEHNIGDMTIINELRTLLLNDVATSKIDLLKHPEETQNIYAALISYRQLAKRLPSHPTHMKVQRLLERNKDNVNVREILALREILKDNNLIRRYNGPSWLRAFVTQHWQQLSIS